MSQVIHHKTNFTSGEVSEDVLGRTDLTCYDNGAATLKNVFIDAIGGVERRAGLRLIEKIPNAVRLIPFTFNTEQTYLFVVCPNLIRIFRAQKQIATLQTPWEEKDIPFLNWTQSADTLLVVHPNYPPVMITRQVGETWNLTNWIYETSQDGAILQPYARFGDTTISIKPSQQSGNISLSTSAPFFEEGHVGIRFRLNGGEVEIFNVISSQIAEAKVIQDLKDVSETADWKEAAFSSVRGYPSSVTFFQSRLVIGGSRDLPNRLWLSKTARIMNFDLGEGNDDEAIEFSILSDQVNAIRAVVPGRHLQIFTSGAEWMVSGDPLTPTNIQLKRQTLVGSPLYASVPPIDVSGATLFVAASGREVREFLFQDIEQAYQAKNVSLLSSHLIRYPIDMAYDANRRIVYVVMQDGSMATLTNYRTENVLAWSHQETQGLFIAVGVVGDDVYVLTKRQNEICLETFDDEVFTDCALLGEDHEGAHELWSGMSPLMGRKVKIIADGIIIPDMTIENDYLTIPFACQKIEVGLAFTHEIVPLPPVSSDMGAGPLKAVRLIQARLRVVRTSSVEMDVGNGLQEVMIPKFSGGFQMDKDQEPLTKDVCLHALGWVRDGMTPLWRIKSEKPKPCKVVSVTTEMKVSN